jgi:hypothetical protein
MTGGAPERLDQAPSGGFAGRWIRPPAGPDSSGGPHASTMQAPVSKDGGCPCGPAVLVLTEGRLGPLNASRFITDRQTLRQTGSPSAGQLSGHADGRLCARRRRELAVTARSGDLWSTRTGEETQRLLPMSSQLSSSTACRNRSREPTCAGAVQRGSPLLPRSTAPRRG